MSVCLCGRNLQVDLLLNKFLFQNGELSKSVHIKKLGE